MRHRWLGWEPAPDAAGSRLLRFGSPQGETSVRANVLVLALGGASWSRLGSDGAWVPWLQQAGVELAPLRASNCGFEIAARDAAAGTGWSEHFAARFAGHALKSVAVELRSPDGASWRQAGEFVVTPYGVEGSLIYAASAQLRDTIEAHGGATLASGPAARAQPGLGGGPNWRGRAARGRCPRT